MDTATQTPQGTRATDRVVIVVGDEQMLVARSYYQSIRSLDFVGNDPRHSTVGWSAGTSSSCTIE